MPHKVGDAKSIQESKDSIGYYENLIFQKLTDQEQVILSVLDYLDK